MSCSYSQKAILGHPRPQSQTRGQVAETTCWECVLNKALPDSEDKLKLSEATVMADAVKFAPILNSFEILL